MGKIVFAIDSFKGCLTSMQACQAAAQGLSEAVIVPVSDGGEGLTEVLTAALGGTLVSIPTHDPLMNPMTATYGISADGTTAIIEMAAACGLPLVPIDKRNPELTTTYGFGEMILDALRRGCRHLILGIGGSATNDAGMGMLQALGASLETSDSRVYSAMPPEARAYSAMPPEARAYSAMPPEARAYSTMPPEARAYIAMPPEARAYSAMPSPATTPAIINGRMLTSLRAIHTSSLSPLLQGVTIQVACDVQNPLCGTNGAAHVFAPQKGADADMVQRLDHGLRNVLSLAHCPQSQPGDGAAGGLGFALRHYLHATLLPGIDLVLQAQHFEEQIHDASLIITGEGKSDRQTLMGKVPYGILQIARRHHIPVHIIAGNIEDSRLLLHAGFASCHCINDGDPAPLAELMQPARAIQNIQKTISRIIVPSP